MVSRALAAAGAAALGAWIVAGASCGGGSATTSSQPEAALAKPDVPEPVLGVAEPNAWRRNPPPLAARDIARRVAALGAASQRFVVDWSLVEPDPPAAARDYRFEPFDAMYRADVARGIRPLIVVLNAPAWAADAGSRPGSFANNPPAASRLADWAAFVAAVAERYPRAIGIEVWNEPNLTAFWASGSPLVRPDPARYAAVLAAAHEAVKEAEPGLPVIGGSVAPTPPAPDGDVPAAEFVRGLLAAGGAENMDALSLHPYPGTGGVARTLAMIDEVRTARDEAGAAMPLWLTEVGVSTSGPAATAEAAQGPELAALCAAAVRAPDVEAVYVHNLVELPGARTSPEPGFGLLQPLPGGGLRAKPAFAAVGRAFARGCGDR